MSDIVTRRNGDILFIGDEPQLIVDIRTQNNYIRIGEKKLPYKIPINTTIREKDKE